MQSYEEFEEQQAKEVMEHDQALVGMIDKSYRLHKEQRQVNKKVNLSFNRLAFAVKQQISQDKQGEKYGNVD